MSAVARGVRCVPCREHLRAGGKRRHVHVHAHAWSLTRAQHAQLACMRQTCTQQQSTAIMGRSMMAGVRMCATTRACNGLPQATITPIVHGAHTPSCVGMMAGPSFALVTEKRMCALTQPLRPRPVRLQVLRPLLLLAAQRLAALLALAAARAGSRRWRSRRPARPAAPCAWAPAARASASPGAWPARPPPLPAARPCAASARGSQQG
jgi:hypothetical protein